VSSPSSESGRVNQKLRTREALLDAAEVLVAAGGRPTVPEVAAAARVSLATAYRYFPSRELLLLEALLAKRSLEPEAVVPDAVRDPAERAVHVQRFLYDLAADNEANFRLYLSGTMQEWVRTGGEAGGTLREGRRMGQIDRALAPARERLDPATYALLREALAGIVGMETYFALTDVCHVDRARATAVMGWAVETLVRAALDGTGAAVATRAPAGRAREHRGGEPAHDEPARKARATREPTKREPAGRERTKQTSAKQTSAKHTLTRSARARPVRPDAPPER
jgi:AcrR family transcriptional regulator